MTKEITKAIILQEIQDKLKLRELEPEIFSFGERVVPIYNIEPHLGSWETISETVSITSAAIFNFFTVPQHQVWTLRAYQIMFMTGAYAITGMYIINRPSSSLSIYLDLKAGQNASYLVNLPIAVRLQPGNTLAVLVDSYTSTGDLRINIDVKKEDIR